ncbi:terpene synthase family protein [Nocardia zapadnayensis]|uniref:terpene synthase family protein n=1 Tax=Nocardia rhamnosiphila TaxID=426716 RepID=UPI002246EDC6|nr:terpene synthase family protein [Nocardia zapadnayensis]MCX0274852.1 terpene synthase family protein [Nocardia zapadnayensis]
MASRYTSALEQRIADMRAQRDIRVRANRPWSLQELFSTPDCDIAEYSREFRPSRFGAQSCAEVEEYCRAQGIWLEPGGAHYNSMTPYLHPGAISADRLTTIGLFNAILFWLNDTVGREKFGHLSRGEQHRARTELDRLCRLLETRTAPEDAAPIEMATVEFLSRLHTQDADQRWLELFLESTVEHLRTAIRDQNARSRRDLLTTDEYIDLRAQVSGMFPAIALCEFGRDSYLDRERLAAAGLADDVRRLQVVTAEIGALMNDMFSFEKECIVDRSDFNLIPVCFLNDPQATLADAVHAAAGVVRDRLTEFRGLHAALMARCAEPGIDSGLAGPVRTHLADLDGCVQATWVWQLMTTRYKGVGIFAENNLRPSSNDAA